MFVFEEDLAENDESSRSTAVSQTHTICNIGVCLSVYCSNWWKVCLQHTAATPEMSYKNSVRTDTKHVFREHITQHTWHTFLYVFIFSAHQACQTTWPFAECPILSAVCSNILWMSVYGRAVCKLTVLSSQGRKNRTKQHKIFRVITAVNIMVTLLLLRTPCSLVLGYQYFGGIFSFHIQDILKKVAVLPP
jgi:hypothetical protein